jgi:hypothetical protein
MAGLRQAARADNITLRKQENAEFWKDNRTKQDAATARRTEQWEKKADAEPSRSKPSPVRAGLTVLDGATGVLSKLVDFLESLFTFQSSSTPREPDQDAVERIIEHRRAADAMKRTGQSVARGEALAASDIRSLTRDQLENIQAKGDDGLRRMIEQMERDRQRPGQPLVTVEIRSWSRRLSKSLSCGRLLLYPPLSPQLARHLVRAYVCSSVGLSTDR